MDRAAEIQRGDREGQRIPGHYYPARRLLRGHHGEYGRKPSKITNVTHTYQADENLWARHGADLSLRLRLRGSEAEAWIPPFPKRTWDTLSNGRRHGWQRNETLVY